MIPKELQEAIEKHILNKVENNKNVAEFEWDILSEGACLALEYMGERWVSVDKEQPEKYIPYWVFGKDVSHGVDLDILIEDKAFWNGVTWIDDKGNRILQYITHFMPYTLPQPPKTTNDEK